MCNLQSIVILLLLGVFFGFQQGSMDTSLGRIHVELYKEMKKVI